MRRLVRLFSNNTDGIQAIVLRRKFVPYERGLRQKSRFLRKNSTFSEVILWNELKGRKLKGYQFRRQVPLLKYIVDFYCRDLGLVIEIDGPVHDLQKSYDSRRQFELEQLGLKFLRFTDWEVKYKLQHVIDKIAEEIESIERERNL